MVLERGKYNNILKLPSINQSNVLERLMLIVNIVTFEIKL